MTQVSRSYKNISIKQKNIGEECFSASYDGFLAPSGSSFSAYLIGKEGVIRFHLAYSDQDKSSLSKRMAKYFYQKDDEIYWRSPSTPDLLYKDIIRNSDTIPLELHQLYSQWNDILDSLSD